LQGYHCLGFRTLQQGERNIPISPPKTPAEYQYPRSRAEKTNLFSRIVLVQQDAAVGLEG